jgi:hypothetical protein
VVLLGLLLAPVEVVVAELQEPVEAVVVGAVWAVLEIPAARAARETAAQPQTLLQ